MQEFSQSHKFHRLGHAGVADQLKTTLGIGALFGEMNQGTKAGGIKEINFAEIEHSRKSTGLEHVRDVIHELLLGVGIELPSEMKQQTAPLLLEPPP